MIRIGHLPAKYLESSPLGFAAGVVSFFGLSKALWETPIPQHLYHYDQHLAGWLAIRLNDLSPAFFPEKSEIYRHFLSQLATEISPWFVTGRFDLAFLIALAVGGGVTYLLGKPLPDTRIRSGRHLWEGETAHKRIRKISKDDIERSGAGIKLHPTFDWPLSNDRETRHVLVIGSVGAGKTQILLPMMQAAIARGDKMVIFDNKGDFTEKLPAPILFAPWDKRSMAWDIAADCTTTQDARELAAKLIPAAEHAEPMWSNSSRIIMTAILLMLQKTQPRKWTWRDLHTAACLSQEELLKIAMEYQREAISALATESKTTQGILINKDAILAAVSDLADAWGDAPPARRFSFSKWLNQENPRNRIIILQGSGRYSELARNYIQAILVLLSGRINSPEYGDSVTRKMWLFLDEFPQLGKMDRFGPFLETGRSKGVRVVIGAQDYAQIREHYGQYIASAWGTMVGTQIIVRVNSGESAQFIAKEVIGYATVDRTVVHNGKLEPPRTEQALVMEPSDLSDYLKADKTGVRGVILGYGNAFILKWPYTTLPKVRPATIPADWVKEPPEATPPAPTAPPPVQSTVPPTSLDQPRLKLRIPTPAEISEMARTGSDIKDSGEEIADMETGGDA